MKNLTTENNATVTLYAKWKYTITYELDGGTNAVDNPTSYTIEDSITLKDPTKDGYTFDTPSRNNTASVRRAKLFSTKISRFIRRLKHIPSKK